MGKKIEILGTGFGGRVKVEKDENGNRILNGRVSVEYLDEVIKVIEDCADKIAATEYYKAAYCRELQGIDPVCLLEFELSSKAYWLKELKNPVTDETEE